MHVDRWRGKKTSCLLPKESVWKTTDPVCFPWVWTHRREWGGNVVIRLRFGVQMQQKEVTTKYVIQKLSKLLVDPLSSLTPKCQMSMYPNISWALYYSGVHFTECTIPARLEILFLESRTYEFGMKGHGWKPTSRYPKHSQTTYSFILEQELCQDVEHFSPISLVLMVSFKIFFGSLQS